MDKIGVIGLGYVGLPLAVEFGKVRHVIGYDINEQRVEDLKSGVDITKEVDTRELHEASNLVLSSDPDCLSDVNIYIITVPTPVDESKQPDLTPLKKASELVGNNLKKQDIVIYESTVFPGCTEEVCVPILAEVSGLTYNVDFFCGYSPERINPGDKEHRLSTIKKVTSGSNPTIAKAIDDLYGEIITAGTYSAASIKVAESAKVIENAQRDLNIAFVNELALIFDKLQIDTREVLEAAGTKWNFLPFTPGLVGGHCIGVDPYYLTHKAESIGYHPQVILAGRRINDNMGIYVANKIVKLMVKKGIIVRNAKALILGITFKDNCPDIRNSKVIDVIRELDSFGIDVDVFDPLADATEVKSTYDLALLDKLGDKSYDTVVLAVAHDNLVSIKLDKITHKDSVLYDMKGVWDTNNVDARL